MFDEFQHDFPRDRSEDLSSDTGVVIPDIAGLPELLNSLGGASFGGGLYRIVHPNDLEMWKLRVATAFPQFEKRIVCFGYDWLGSIFALDTQRLVGGQPGVIMFEPGTGKALEILADVLTFHNAGLREFGEAALAISFFQKWLNGGGKRPSVRQCVGYKNPLFLGGTDGVENLELSDIGVYWHVMGQLIRKVRGLPVGTPLRVSPG